MKNGTSFLAGLVAGLILTILAFIVIIPKKTFLVYESKLNFNETVQMIESSAKENKWSIPQQYDLQKTMKKHGYEVDPIIVFSLCKPEFAYKILSGKEERLASAMMPCRVAIYERDGKTYISMLNSALFSKLMGKNIKTVMSAAVKENLELLEPVIK